MIQPLFVIASDSLIDSMSQPVTIIPAITQSGQDQANVTVTAINTGPIIANAGTLTNILTPVSGLTGVLNTLDAVVGTNVETDNAYRARMARSLQIAGAGTVPAIQERVAALPGVTSSLVYENVTDITDINNIPPHSFECFVTGGDNTDIANLLWQIKPAGIGTYGTTSVVIYDSQGVPHTIKFSRPEQVSIYINITVTVNATYPVDGDTLVKEALAAYINELGQGADIIVNPKLIAQLASIPGIDDTAILIGTDPGPTLPDNIVIQPFQIAFTQTDFINVTDIPG